MDLTPIAFGAQKALFLCSKAHTDVQPCFPFLNLRLQAQLYAGLILSILLVRCQPNFGLFKSPPQGAAFCGGRGVGGP